jgi:hypothetical protein
MRLVLALALLLASPAFAQTGQAVLSCTPPTQNTDGSAIVGTISYKFYRGTTATSQTTASPVQSSCAYTWTGLPAGTHYFSATATVGGQESARSVVASKTIVFTPNPPTSLTVAADLVAWTIVQSRDRVALVAVGTVAAGTQCDASQPVLDKWVVPRGAVTFAGSVRPEVVLASCS